MYFFKKIILDTKWGNTFNPTLQWINSYYKNKANKDMVKKLKGIDVAFNLNFHQVVTQMA